MADILPVHHHKKACIAKTKNTALRVDLTPMVDLGFLLIAFFVFTTTIKQSTAMKLALPDDSSIKQPSEVAESKTLNLLLGANNNVYVYSGSKLKDSRNIGSSTTALRNAILEKKAEIKNRFVTGSGMVVLIKPAPASTYADVVGTLDEMLICDVKTYVLMDISDAELNVINQ